MLALVEMDGIEKSFGPTKVLRAVNFGLQAGSVHALMGENGAGKSTLMRILAGVFLPTMGEVRLRGEAVRFRDPKEARRKGISTVFQEFTLIPNLTVAENMFLGHEPKRRDGSIDSATVVKQSQRILDGVFPAIDARTIVERLSVAQLQQVEIAKGLSTNAEVFIFDEPTAALSTADAEHLFGVIRSLKAQGKGIVYISHRMAEVFELSDQISVMKDGAMVRSSATADFTMDSLVRAMVGRELQTYYPARSGGIGTTSLEVRSLTPLPTSPTVSLNLRRGEILGLAGLEGQGQREIMRGAVGIMPAHDASVHRITGTGQSAQVGLAKGFSAAIANGIGFIPEDRKSEGLFLGLPITENVAFGKQLNRSFAAKAWWSREGIQRVIAKLRVAAADPTVNVGRLSGGNQQKVLLARWFLSGVEVLVIEEPTRGVDVGAKSEIYRLLREFADNGGAVLVSSRELTELIGLCDNILIVHNHDIVASVSADGATEESILGTALGSDHKRHPAQAMH